MRPVLLILVDWLEWLGCCVSSSESGNRTFSLFFWVFFLFVVPAWPVFRLALSFPEFGNGTFSFPPFSFPPSAKSHALRAAPLLQPLRPCVRNHPTKNCPVFPGWGNFIKTHLAPKRLLRTNFFKLHSKEKHKFYSTVFFLNFTTSNQAGITKWKSPFFF